MGCFLVVWPILREFVALKREPSPFWLQWTSTRAVEDANGDADYYTWTAVPDVPDAATKETIFRYWTAEDGLLDGEELLDNRVYK